MAIYWKNFLLVTFLFFLGTTAKAQDATFNVMSTNLKVEETDEERAVDVCLVLTEAHPLFLNEDIVIFVEAESITTESTDWDGNFTDSLTFTPSSGPSQCVSIIITGDNIVEEEELFSVTFFSNNERYLVANFITNVTIVDDDGVVLEVEQATPDTITESSTMISEMCVRLADVGEGLERDVIISVSFFQQDEYSQSSDFILMAMEGVDSKMESGDAPPTLYFDPSSTVEERRCASFEAVQDSLVEGIEEFTFAVNFMNPLDSYFNEQQQFSISVEDDDGVELAIVETSNVEENSTMERMLCIQLINVFDGLERSVLVLVEPELSGFSTEDDFNITESSVSFDSGSQAGTEACLTFVPINDLFIEDNEHFLFQTAPESHLDVFGKSSPTSFSLEILDNDGLFPNSSFSGGATISLLASTDEPVLEGHHLSVCASFQALALPLQREILVELVIPDNFTDEIFFEKGSGSILFSTSSEGLQECVEVHANDDMLIENTETVAIQVDLDSLAPNDMVVNVQVTVVIKDNDAAEFSVVSTSLKVEEGDEESAVDICLDMTHTEQSVLDTDIMISVEAESITTESTDWDGNFTNSLTFTPSSGPSQCVSIIITGDNIVEEEELFSVTFFSNNELYLITSATTNVTIEDDDGVTVEVEQVTPDTISESSTMVSEMCVRLAGVGEGLERDVIISISFMQQSTYSQSSDFVLTAMEGIDSKLGDDGASPSVPTLYFDPSSVVEERRCASFEAVQDSLVEGIEEFSFAVNFMNPLDSFFNEQQQFSIGVEDDDGVELATVMAASNVEEEVNMQRVLCIRLVNVSDGLERNVLILVEPNLSGFSSADDFNITGNSVSFNSGSQAGTEACLTFVPIDDLFIEDNEHFTFHTEPESHLDVFGKNSLNSFSLEILDNDGATISLSTSTDEPVLEGHHLSVCASFQALALPLQREILVELVIPDNYTDEIFFEKGSGSILFSTSSEGLQECVEVHANDDTLIENLETVAVQVDFDSLAPNDVVENGQVTIVIKDNDEPTAEFSTKDLTLDEGATDLVEVCVTVTGDFGGRSVSIHIDTSLNENDLVSISGEELSSISSSGTYCGFIMVVDDDHIEESEENHSLALRVDEQLVESTLLVTIIDNDFAEVEYIARGEAEVDGVPSILEGDPKSFVELCLFTSDLSRLDREVIGTASVSDSRRTNGVDMISISPETFSLKDGDICIEITASNDDFVADHSIRDFEVQVLLDSDLFAGTQSASAKVVFLIIEDDSTLIEGVDYIEFIDLDVEDEGVISRVLPDAQGLETGDYYSNPIYVDQGIPIGARAELTSAIYVLSDGAISFDRPIALYQPQTFPLEGNLANLQLVAPFLADHDPRQFGSVRYKVYSGSTDNTKLVSQFIRGRNYSLSFAGNWMLVAEWFRVPLYSAEMTDPDTTNTYQAIIISDGAETFTVFTYNCDQLQWTGEVGEYAAIGFSVLGDVENFRNFENFGLSRRPQVGMVACSNQRNNRLWTNLIYKIGAVVSTEQIQRSMCLSQISGDQERFSLQPVMEASLEDPFVRRGFGLIDCPCSYLQATRDSRFTLLERANNICFVSKFSVLVEDVSLLHRCCYNAINLALTSAEDQEGYGSVLLMSTSSNLETILAETADLQGSCCGRVGLCNLFYQRRPSSDCEAYQPQIYSWALGDPHFTTLDRAMYTFNGWGEYILIMTQNFVFQGRTTAVNASLEGSATQFSAFAFGVQDAIVEIRLDNGDLQVLLNNTDITNTVSTVNQTNNNSPLVFFERIAENTIQTSFSNNVGLSVSSSFGLLSFVATIPETFQGLTRGLLGNFNQNATDDLIFRDGLVLSAGASDSEIHDFGQSWQISPSESLFSYPVGHSSQNFSFPEHVPLFADEVVANASDDIQQRCGDNVRCIFDASQTGNVDIGLDTMQMDDTIVENRDISNNNPPNITGPNSFMVVLNEFSQFMIAVMDTNLVSLNITIGDVEGGELTLESQSSDISTYIFSWTPTGVINGPIVFVATDLLGASSQYVPQIQFCSCMNNGSCTLGGILDLTANPVTLNCDCSTATGYEGRFCEIDIDGCAELACFTEDACEDIPAPGVGANCSPCPPGYTGDGRKCTDLNECLGEGDNNTCEQECINHPGGYNCSCFSGYASSSPTECEDIDECLAMNGGCHQVCNNTEGTRVCSCEEGFELMEDAINCQVIASLECNNETTNCTQNCMVDEITEMDICSCEIGFVLNETDLFTCDDIDECLSDPCEHSCENTVSSFQCACNEGFVINQDGRSCSDIDECVEAVLNGRQPCMDESMLCVNSIGSFVCSCPGNTEFFNGECREPVVMTTLAPTPKSTSVFETTTPEITPEATVLEITTQAVTPDETEPQTSTMPDTTQTSQATTSQTTMPEATTSQTTSPEATTTSQTTIPEATTLGATTMQETIPETSTMPETAETATMPEASTSESTSPQTTMNVETTTPTIATVLPQVVRENAVTVTLAGLRVEMFTEALQQQFIAITVRAINSYCEDNQNLCGKVDVTVSKRQAAQIEEENVIITNIRNNARQGVDFDMYVTITQNQLLNQQALLNSIVEMASAYRDAGFSVFFRVVVPATESPVTSAPILTRPVIVGIVVALIIALTVVSIIIAVVCYIHKRRRHGKVVLKDYSRVPPQKLINTTTFMEHGNVEESVVVANAAARGAEDAESVHSARLEFFEQREDSPNFEKMEMGESGGEIKVDHGAIEEGEKVTSF